jgi:hypothetical protein
MAYKNIFRQELIKNYKGLQILFQKNGMPFHLQYPAKLNTKEELLKFSKQINQCITFPEFHYLKR